MLTIFEKLYDKPKCIAGCNFNSPRGYYLSCVKCQFNVHLWCSYLPKNIEHSSHHHPFTLKDISVYTDYGEEFCDICEMDRDRRECIFYSQECDFVAEFNCLFSEVLLSLKKAKLGDDQFRTVDRNHMDMVIKDCLDVQDKLNSLTDEEEKQIKGIVEDVAKVNIDNSDKSYYLDGFLSKLTVAFKSRVQEQISSEKFWDFQDEVADAVGDYKIPQNLVLILGRLIEKNRDIGGPNRYLTQD